MEVTNEAKNAILNIFANAAWAVPNGQQYYDALADAFFGVAYISAVYTPSGTVTTTTPLNDLKTDLVVTATLKDSTTEIVPSTDYTLSGTLEVGTSTITVSYAGKTTTFTATVVQGATASWDFTQSLVDSVNGYTAAITAPATGYGTIAQTTNGLEYTVGSTNGMQGNVKCASIVLTPGDAAVFEIETSASFSGNAGNKGSIYGLANGAILQILDPDILVIGFRGQYDKFYSWYGSGWHDDLSAVDPDFFNGKTVKITVESNGNLKVYADNVLIGTLATESQSYSGICFGNQNATGRQSYGNMTIKNLTITRAA